MSFESPAYFLLIFLIPLFYWISAKFRKGLIYPDIKMLPLKSYGRAKWVKVPEVLFHIGILCFIMALSGPYRSLGEGKDYTRGYLMYLLIDRSGSMGSYMDKEGENIRLDIVKRVVKEFIQGNDKDLKGRIGDRIGLISFARYADTMTPLTVSHDIVTQMVDSMKLASEDEDGTSIGDALALGVARILSYQSESRSDASDSSVIILLTDGQNNSGSTRVEDAAALAKEYNIKVYTIGFGGGYYQNAFGLIRPIPPEYGIDEDTLQSVAEFTGGQYFNSGNEKSLIQVYQKIDELEKTDIENAFSIEKDYFFMPWIYAGFLFMLIFIILRFLIFNLVDEA